MKLKIEYIQGIINDYNTFKYNGFNSISYKSGGKYIHSLLFERKDGEYRFIKHRLPEYAYKSDIICAQILSYVEDMRANSFLNLYSIKPYSSMCGFGFYLGVPYYKIDKLDINSVEVSEKWKMQYYDRHSDKYIETEANFEHDIEKKINIANNCYNLYKGQGICDIENYFKFILSDSFYWFEFNCKPSIQYNAEDKTLIAEYCLPNIEEIPNIKELKEYVTKSDEVKFLSERELNKIYDDFIYAITLRSIAEIFHFDECNKVDTVRFNGMIEDRSKITGKLETTCILSIMVKKSQLEDVDFSYVDAKALFKHLKGVSATKLHTLTAIAPIMEINRSDKRFVESHSVGVDSSTNLAAMDWEEFEHLIRELFEKEFNVSGGEVKVTQSSRDGGVDAIAFDPDPIRGGKIVIQAKRYTNTVGVSAVRDLYGTVMNEGANKGILVTTSDYGSDSYDFAKGKPITLLNGGHILYLLEKHGQKARIDIEEARLSMKTPN